MRQVCDACKANCQPIQITDIEGKPIANVCNDCKLALKAALDASFQAIQDAHP